MGVDIRTQAENIILTPDFDVFVQKELPPSLVLYDSTTTVGGFYGEIGSIKSYAEIYNSSEPATWTQIASSSIDSEGCGALQFKVRSRSTADVDTGLSVVSPASTDYGLPCTVVGPFTEIPAGVLHVVSSEASVFTQRISTQVGNTDATSGTFTRDPQDARYMIQTIEDSGILTDDGELIVVKDAYDGDGYFYMGEGFVYGVTSGISTDGCWIKFVFDSQGITTIASQGDISITDTSGKLCFTLNGTELSIINRLGFSCNIKYWIKYSCKQDTYQ